MASDTSTRMNLRPRKVVIVQSTIRHYRASFFRRLHERLARDGIILRVVYSDPNAQEARKNDCVDLDSGVGAKVRAKWLLGDRVVYQHAWREAADAHLVIVEHASKHLLSYALFASRVLSPRKVALWGHGFSQTGTPLGRFLRRRMLRLPDWWFAYTGVTLRYLLENGVPAEITTNVQNAIDTDGFSRATEGVTPEECAKLRGELGIGPRAPVGLFCASLYAHKRLSLLIESSAMVRAQIPDFQLLIIGDGADRQKAKDAAARFPWVHYVGPKFGNDRALYFRLADLVMSPGLVGLGILDAFAAGLPVLTTDLSNHGPEIEYLEDGLNGIVTRPDAVSFARAAVDVLSNPDLLSCLRTGASRSGRKYTLGNMVRNFAEGVQACLECERSMPRTLRTSF